VVVCILCGRTFKRVPDLRRHVKSTHLQSMTARTCWACDRTFKSAESLLLHCALKALKAKDADDAKKHAVQYYYLRRAGRYIRSRVVKARIAEGLREAELALPKAHS
jgi:uncharacterized C2H2 Zn-finger protein